MIRLHVAFYARFDDYRRDDKMNISRISVSNSARDEIDREFEPKFSIYQKTLPRVGTLTAI